MTSRQRSNASQLHLSVGGFLTPESRQWRAAAQSIAVGCQSRNPCAEADPSFIAFRRAPPSFAERDRQSVTSMALSADAAGTQSG